MNSKSDLKQSVQGFGRFLSGMVMPNIGAFIAWGVITALFIPSGPFPNEHLAKLVDPMLSYLIPLLIAYTGGKALGGSRGGVMGAIAAMGVLVGAGIPMILGAMIMGPLGGFIIKKTDDFLEDKIPSGFEMLINNFSLGILGMILALLGYLVIGPIVQTFSNALSAGVQVIVNAGLLPLVSVFIEPGKVLFLNNAINHGVLGPLGIEQAQATGQSIFFLLETNPGPGLGILLAYFFFSKGNVKQSTPGAIIIHFLGGIHEIYFPYVLMNPITILAVIAGGAAGIFTFSILGAGLVAPPSPGSIFALSAMTIGTKGGFLPVFIGVLVSTGVSFLIASIFVKRAANRMSDEEFDSAKNKSHSMKLESKGEIDLINPKSIIYACDAGMGSSAMGATMLKKRLKEKGIDISVKNYAINEIPRDASIVVTHEQLTNRAKASAPNAFHIPVKDFLDMSIADELESLLKNHKSFTKAEVPVSFENTNNEVILKQNILLSQKDSNKEDAIKKAGKLLVKSGYVEADYVDAMLKREKDVSTYIGKGVAIPHGVEIAKKSINKSGISVLLYPEGVDFDGERAYIVIGIAGKENEHLGIIAKIADILDNMGEEGVKNLSKSMDINYVYSFFR